MARFGQLPAARQRATPCRKSTPVDPSPAPDRLADELAALCHRGDLGQAGETLARRRPARLHRQHHRRGRPRHAGRGAHRRRARWSVALSLLAVESAVSDTPSSVSPWLVETSSLALVVVSTTRARVGRATRRFPGSAAGGFRTTDPTKRGSTLSATAWPSFEAVAEQADIDVDGIRLPACEAAVGRR